jgi:hypothetical protein
MVKGTGRASDNTVMSALHNDNTVILATDRTDNTVIGGMDDTDTCRHNNTGGTNVTTNEDSLTHRMRTA